LAKDRAVLHRIFALATKMEYREGNPVADVDAPKSDGRTPVILSTEEYDRLIAACDERPMRGGDSHRTKTGKGRWVPMTPRLQRAMREHFARYRFATHKGEPTPWVFHHERTGRRHKAGARIQSMYAAYKSAARRADLSADFNQHDLRHRRVTTWLAEGKNPVHVKEAMGHADLATTMGYTHLAKEHLRSLG
jgi:integrase/recombinase XerD